MSQVVVFLALAFSVLIALFAVQNNTFVDVSFLTLSIKSVAVSVLVLVSAVLGAAAMLLLGIAREIGLRWRQRSVAQQLKAAQARIAQLEAAQPAPSSAPALSPSSTPVASDQSSKT